MDAIYGSTSWDAGERTALTPIQDSLEYLVSVPIDPIEDKNGDRFDLYYFVHTPAVRTLKSVLFCAGGPGQIVRPFDRSKTYVDFLAKNGYNVVFFHLRGTGFSQLPPPTKYDRFMKCEYAIVDMEAIRRHFLEETMGGKDVKWEAVIGWSFGTVLAQMYAHEFKEGLEKLVLISPLSRHRFSESPKDAFYDYYCSMLAIYRDTLKKIYSSKHETLENEFGEMSDDEITDVLDRLFGNENGILKRTEEAFGNIQVVVDSYSKLPTMNFPDHIKFSRDFYESLRDLRFLGSNSVDDTGGTYEKQRLIAKNLRDEVLNRIVPGDRRHKEGPDAEVEGSRYQGSQRAYYSFGVRDGINWTFLSEYHRSKDVQMAIRAMGGRVRSDSEGMRSLNGWLNKIEAGSVTNVKAWDPKPLRHKIPTLIVNGDADPVTAGGQAERYFHPDPPGAMTLITFPGVGHNISLGSWATERSQKFKSTPPPLNGAIHLTPPEIPAGEVREVTGIAHGWRLDPNLGITIKPPESFAKFVEVEGCGILRGGNGTSDVARTGAIVVLIKNMASETIRINDEEWQLETTLFSGKVKVESSEPISKNQVRLLYGTLTYGQTKKALEYQIEPKKDLQLGLTLVGFSVKPPSSVELWIRNNSDKMINQDSGDWTIKSRNFERTFRVNLPEIQPRETKSVVWGVDGFKVSINEALQVEPRDVSLSNVVACLQPQSRHSRRLSFTVWNRDKNQTQRVDRSRWSVKTAAFSVSVVLDRIELEPGAVATVEGDATGMEWAKCLDFKPDKNQESPLELICYNIKSENEVSLLLRNPTKESIKGKPCVWIYVIPTSNANLVDLNQALNVLLFSFLVLRPYDFHDRNKNEILNHVLAKFESVGLKVAVKPDITSTSGR